MRGQFLQLPSLAWVAAGGAVGAAAREGLTLALPEAGRLSWAVVLANVIGAFALGLLYAGLDRRASGQLSPAGRSPKRLPRGKQLRLLLGTGFCGGFTTYSSFAVGVVLLGASSTGPVWAAVCALGVVIVGALATWTGLALGTKVPTAAGKQPTDVPDISGAQQQRGQRP